MITKTIEGAVNCKLCGTKPATAICDPDLEGKGGSASIECRTCGNGFIMRPGQVHSEELRPLREGESQTRWARINRELETAANMILERWNKLHS